MDAELEQVLTTFEAQTRDGLVTMEEALLAIENGDFDSERTNEIFRVCHTIKGDADSLGFVALTEFAHVLEDVLGEIRRAERRPSGSESNLLLAAVDALREILDSTLEGRDELSDDHRRCLAALRGDHGSPRPERTVDRVAAPAFTGSDANPTTIGDSVRLAAPTLRIRVETLDRLMNLAGELSIARGRLDQVLHDGRSAPSSEVLEAHRAMDHLFASLQEEVMRVRMVPLGPVFRQHARSVRELALTHGKRAHLEIRGEDAEVDTTVIGHLREALIHVIRNALAHGIEAPEARLARGKPASGRVVLSARQEGAQIVVEVEDDGGGVDLDAVRRRAASLGLVADAAALGPNELLELVFHPGFSTRDEADHAAGRGVGMDAVRRTVESVGGTVRLRSRPGAGTIATLRLPLTLAIIEGFAVGTARQVYVLPLESVIECLDLPTEGRHSRGGATGLLSVRDRPLPYVRLDRVLGLPSSEASRGSVVVVEHAGRRLGLLVDRLLGERQTVIKPLPRHLRNVPEVGGATILGDGRIALILDVRALIDRAIGGIGDAELLGPESNHALVSTDTVEVGHAFQS